MPFRRRHAGLLLPPPQILEGLNLTMAQFVDVCILSGCDYCETIKGVAATTALKEIKKWGTLEEVVAHLDKDKVRVAARGWVVAAVGI